MQSTIIDNRNLQAKTINHNVEEKRLKLCEIEHKYSDLVWPGASENVFDGRKKLELIKIKGATFKKNC